MAEHAEVPPGPTATPRLPPGTIRGLLIDLDGVVYIGNTPIAGVRDFFARLRRHGLPFRLITNNSTQTPAQFAVKLAGMDISVSEAEVLTSAEATGDYLAQHAPVGARVLLIGEQGLRIALSRRGFRLDERPAQLVVVGLDRTFDFEKLTEAIRAVQAGASLIGTNPDLTLPTEAGDLPGTGTLLAAISAATGVSPTIVGKPEPTMLQLGAGQLGLPPDKVAVIGDRLDTDVRGAKRAGMLSILVLTGVTMSADLDRQREVPDMVVASLDAAGELLFEEWRSADG